MIVLLNKLLELLVSYRAMEDAELMIRLFPEHAKSYYRKGEILTALKVNVSLSSRTYCFFLPVIVYVSFLLMVI
jgi:hypothetical protein